MLTQGQGVHKVSTAGKPSVIVSSDSEDEEEMEDQNVLSGLAQIVPSDEGEDEGNDHERECDSVPLRNSAMSHYLRDEQRLTWKAGVLMK